MSADTMAQLANMVDSQNRPIFDVAGVFQQSGLPSIKGRPVLEQNDIGNKIFFGNLKMYWIGASRQIRIDVADQATVRGQSMWERDMIAIRAEEKIDGEVADVRAFAEINGV
jgi:HK97 family phage major capsid protein